MRAKEKSLQRKFFREALHWLNLPLATLFQKALVVTWRIPSASNAESANSKQSVFVSHLMAHPALGACSGNDFGDEEC